MIIGIDASRANQQSKTGTEWYSYILLKKFAELDKENRYNLFVENPPLEVFFNIGKNFKVKVLRWPLGRFWHQGRISLEIMFNKIDVLFVPAHTIPLVHPRNTVTTCHDIGFEKYPELYSPSELRYHRWAMRFAVKHARKIITVSQFSKQEILNAYQANADQIKVIHHGVDTEFYCKRDDSVVDQVLNKLGINKPYLFFIGRIEKKKNIINQIKAFNLLKQKYQVAHQLIFGGNFGFGIDEIKEEIEASPFKDEIKLIGYVETTDLPVLYSAADIFWFITNYEGFGMPILEAQACKTPVVASNICSIPEIGGRGVALVNPSNIEEIAEVSYSVLTDASQQQELVQAGLNNIQRFDWLNTAQETLNLILDRE
ncbi:MAG: glycosyltransferase family 1 protein [Patescibacteria group bacterium]